MSQWFNSLPKIYQLGINVAIHAFALGLGVATLGPVVIIYYVLGFAFAAALHSLDQEE